MKYILQSQLTLIAVFGQKVNLKVLPPTLESKYADEREMC